MPPHGSFNGLGCGSSEIITFKNTMRANYQRGDDNESKEPVNNRRDNASVEDGFHDVGRPAGVFREEHGGAQSNRNGDNQRP